jgi:hypothetical protein
MMVLSSETASIRMRTTCSRWSPSNLVEHPSLGPTMHAGVDRVPVAEPLGHAAPLAAVLGHVQHGIDRLQVNHADIAALSRWTVLDKRELLDRDPHADAVSSTILTIAIGVDRP